MKGYAEVEVYKAFKARENFLMWRENMKNTIEELIEEYYNQEYSKLSWFGRWLHRKDTPQQFFSSQLGFCCSYDEELWKVANDDKLLDDIRTYSFHSWDEHSRSIRKLVSSAQGTTIKLDQNLCGFIEKWFVE